MRERGSMSTTSAARIRHAPSARHRRGRARRAATSVAAPRQRVARAAVSRSRATTTSTPWSRRISASARRARSVRRTRDRARRARSSRRVPAAAAPTPPTTEQHDGDHDPARCAAAPGGGWARGVDRRSRPRRPRAVLSAVARASRTRGDDGRRPRRCGDRAPRCPAAAGSARRRMPSPRPRARRPTRGMRGPPRARRRAPSRPAACRRRRARRSRGRARGSAARSAASHSALRRVGCRIRAQLGGGALLGVAEERGVVRAGAPRRTRDAPHEEGGDDERMTTTIAAIDGEPRIPSRPPSSPRTGARRSRRSRGRCGRSASARRPAYAGSASSLLGPARAPRRRPG